MAPSWERGGPLNDLVIAAGDGLAWHMQTTEANLIAEQVQPATVQVLC